LTDAKITGSRQEVRKFGLLFSGICVIIGAYLLYVGHTTWIWFAAGALFFLTTGLIGYPILRPVYMAWMKFAFVLAWVNTRLLLGVFFFLILTPVGCLMRLFGKDFLDERIDKNSASYWKKRAAVPFDRTRYQRLF
jgi:hypothetical protein